MEREMTRRSFLKQVVGLVAIGIIAPPLIGCGEEPQVNPLPTPEGHTPLVPIGEGPYGHWGEYANKALPAENVLEIGRDLARNSMYSGFSEVGKLMVELQTDPKKLHDYLSIAVPNKPMEIRLSQLVQTDGAIGIYQMEYGGKYITTKIKDKKTGKEEQSLWGLIDTINEVFVGLDNSFVNVPDFIKQLLIVKEFSHFLYIAQQKKLILQEVTQKYALTEPKNLSDLPTYLYYNGRLKQNAPELHIPSLGDLFDHTTTDLDGAGYWHIMRAYGKMKRQKLPNGKPLLSDEIATQFLKSDNDAFEAALQKGILIEHENGEFTWKEGIGPFSPEWTGITRSILKGNKSASLGSKHLFSLA